MAQHGIHPTLKLHEFDPEEQQLIRKMSRIWFVTFARAGRSFKGVNYNYFFAKPTDSLARNFNFEREVLVVLSQFNSYDGRLMDFVDRTLEEFQNRLDKLCVILISKDGDIRNKIKQISIQDNEARIIVPYTYDEIIYATNTENVCLDRLKEFFHTRDLFAFDSPLKTEAYFYGRTKTIQDLYAKYRAGENGCLFGLRRIGKTSALLALKRYMEMKEEPAVFMDCSEPSFHFNRWNEVLWFIVENVVKSLNLTKINRCSKAEYEEKSASMSFEKDLLAIHKLCNGRRIMLILDEIENITFAVSPSKHWTEEKDFIFFWQSIRSIYQKRNNLFSVIIAGVNPIAVETATVQSHDNPIYRFITPNYLGFFDYQDTKEMVSSIGKYMGLSFDEEIFTYLMEDYGGHPFLTRQACSRLNKTVTDSRPCRVTKYKYLDERDSIKRYIHDYVDLILNVLKTRYSIEYELLEHLAQEDHTTFLSFARDSHLFIEHLDGYGLIKEEKGKYYFKIKTVEEYIVSKARIAKRDTPKEEKRRELSNKRNQLEENMRQVVKLVMKAKYGNKAKDRILDTLPSEQRGRFLERSLDEVLKSSFFENLRIIITKYWPDFALIFLSEKDKFNNFMECINKYRKLDAHAGDDIPDDDWASLNIALKWLTDCVSSYLE